MFPIEVQARFGTTRGKPGSSASSGATWWRANWTPYLVEARSRDARRRLDQLRPERVLPWRCGGRDDFLTSVSAWTSWSAISMATGGDVRRPFITRNSARLASQEVTHSRSSARGSARRRPSRRTATAGFLTASVASAAVPCAAHAPNPDTSLIHARGLTKRFGDFVAVDAIDFDVAPGEAFGFLGPNGAGKTSTMRMIGCVSPVTDGDAAGARHGPGDATARGSARGSASCRSRTRSTPS